MTKNIGKSIKMQLLNLARDEKQGYLKKHGIKFVGTPTIYSYLQAISIINPHEEECWLHKGFSGYQR